MFDILLDELASAHCDDRLHGVGAQLSGGDEDAERDGKIERRSILRSIRGREVARESL
jgi:hypothetical protein